jgi:type III restriction enzyme
MESRDLKTVQHISGRLSLRSPQESSLKLLAYLADALPLHKKPGETSDLSALIEAIKAQIVASGVSTGSPARFSDFERAFPSICFNLATGVGKTRLMGAFIGYLAIAKGIRNFFVLAPNLTIYRKLISDFTYSNDNAKYVFRGLNEFAIKQPRIITDDNYEQGQGVREYRKILMAEGVAVQQELIERTDEIVINVFNIAKLTSESRGGKQLRMRRDRETIGVDGGYFGYLAGLPDLVMLMDESHRYRGEGGMRALDELRPVLALELTATPQTERGGNTTAFKNVVFDYPLAHAMRDGFVKQPAVATRLNLRAGQTPTDMERMKLEDGVHLHEHTKTKLTIYTTEMKLPPVKPFMLVVASNIDHARGLEVLMSSPEFFGARYAGKVITVHSEGSGSEKDEIVEKLLTVEDPANPVEVVIHVNMLKEGWDVKNLYTIVPLRAANAKTLVEQTIGRGLRLPFGTRTGVPEVDQLTIVAHDKFDEIVTAAREGGLHFQQTVIGRDVPLVGSQAVPVPTAAQVALGLAPAPAPVAPPASASGSTTPVPSPTVAPPVLSPEERRATEIAVNAMDQYRARLDSSADLAKPEVRAAMVKEVERAYAAGQQQTIEGVTPPKAPDFNQIVARVATTESTLKIDIPRIIIQPVGEVRCGFNDFNLDVTSINQQPNTGTIVSRDLSTDEERRLEVTDLAQERRLEDHLVHLLLDAPEIDYDSHAKLLYKLSGQVVGKLRSYLPEDEAIRNVLRAHRRTFVELIRAQMRDHSFEEVASYEPIIAEGWIRLDAGCLECEEGVEPRDYRLPPPDDKMITEIMYGGFTKCVYPRQKFHSDPERKLAVVCERDPTVLKWMKPFRVQFPIHLRNGRNYEPDFVIETNAAKLLVEVKRRVDLTTTKVLENKNAAAIWCGHATDHAKSKGLKPWHYLLIPHDEVKEATDMAGYAAGFTVQPVIQK